MKTRVHHPAHGYVLIKCDFDTKVFDEGGTYSALGIFIPDTSSKHDLRWKYRNGTIVELGPLAEKVAGVEGFFKVGDVVKFRWEGCMTVSDDEDNAYEDSLRIVDVRCIYDRVEEIDEQQEVKI